MLPKRDYPTMDQNTAHPPGTRLYAAGFRISDPPGRIIRDMEPTLVEFTCGQRTPEDELLARATETYAWDIAPIGPDGLPVLARTTTSGNLAFFSDLAGAETYYRDQVTRALAETDAFLSRITSKVGDFRLKVEDILAEAPPYPDGCPPLTGQPGPAETQNN